MYNSVIADRETYTSPIKKVKGKDMILVATKTSRRILRKGKTEYIYHMVGTKGIYYNQAKGGVVFFPIAKLEFDMKRHYELYCVEPLTPAELEYLKLYPNIKLVE